MSSSSALFHHRSKANGRHSFPFNYLISFGGSGEDAGPWHASFHSRSPCLAGNISTWTFFLFLSFLSCSNNTLCTMRPPVELSVFLLSLLAPGVLYAMNNTPALQEPLPILGMGMVVLGSVLLLLLLTVRHKMKVDPLFYVFAEFSFTCMVGLTNALEQDGFISGFMGFYLKKGEPHLSTAYAVMMSYWEGVFHLVLFQYIIHCMFKGKSYRSLGLLWAGSSIAHQIVLIPGVVIGKYGSNIRPVFWRNVPFFLLPFWVASVLFSRHREMPVVTADKIVAEQKKGLLSRPVDLLLSLLLMGSMAFSVFRGFVVLDCPLDVCFTYIYQYEPYLKDPVGFPRVMMLVYLFYALPLLTVLIYGLKTPGCSWMLDWTIFFAGAMAQTQWCHIGASLHSRTPFTYRVPADKWWPVITPNVLLAAVPALLALRCHTNPAFFMKPVPKGQTDNEKKKK
ncbi:transmembrane 6 superfamily member 2 isoform X1 [Scophthalmus maximus]|uniref:transmembrane 6 superfamily member 2 isoform X1 n=2 Tax=Scophthalmus maximus TaxID=52904 RepID=UPI001FA91D66|nr:transmembrane 6 superfamily member 2 isoform X1 [Scophthalmus maximus]